MPAFNYIPEWYKNAKPYLNSENKKIPVYGNGKQIREWTYVKDTCKAVLHIMQNGNCGEIYNISSNIEKENIDSYGMSLWAKERLSSADHTTFVTQITGFGTGPQTHPGKPAQRHFLRCPWRCPWRCTWRWPWRRASTASSPSIRSTVSCR